jgi:hypothetical protein
MKTNSIYTDNDFSSVVGPTNRIAAFAMELNTVENLLTMGYVFSGRVRLADRQKELYEEIDRLEKLRKLERGGFFVGLPA